MEDAIQLAWHVLTGSTSPSQSVAVWELSTITTEAINREHQRVATGATATITATDHSTTNPGGGASKNIMAVASPILLPSRSANYHDNQSKRPKTQRIAEVIDVELYSCRCFIRGVVGLLPPTQERLKVIPY